MLHPFAAIRAIYHRSADGVAVCRAEADRHDVVVGDDRGIDERQVGWHRDREGVLFHLDSEGEQLVVQHRVPHRLVFESHP